jgi:protein CMS1
MADDLDENFVLDDKNQNFSEPESDQESLSGDEESNNRGDKTSNNNKKRSSNQSGQEAADNKAKKKKMNITEILKLNQKELKKASYPTKEFKKIVKKYISENLSGVEKNNFGMNDSMVDKQLSKMLLKRKTTHNLKLAEQFDKKFNKKIKQYLNEVDSKKSENKNTPTLKPFIIVLCSSAIRCIEFQKELQDNKFIKSKQLNWFYAFAKHKKLEEQISFLKTLSKKKNSRIDLIYATPKRLHQLLDSDCFSLVSLKYVMIDYSFRDVKQKRFIDINDIKKDFFDLYSNHLMNLNREETIVKYYLA